MKNNRSKRNLGEEIVEGLREVLAFKRGEKHDLRVVAVRAKPVKGDRGRGSTRGGKDKV